MRVGNLRPGAPGHRRTSAGCPSPARPGTPPGAARAAVRAPAGAVAAALIGLLAAGSPASAQETIHWPLRTHPGPEALAEGAAAPFWNPAGMGAAPGRGTALVVDSRSPSAIGLSGFAVGATYAVRPDMHVGVALRHVGIDGIDRTTDSPLPDPGGDALEAAEDRFHASFAWTPRPGISVGAGVRYARVSDLLGGDEQAGASLGARWSPALPLRPVLALAGGSERGEAAWAAALRLEAPLPETLADWGLLGEAGIRHTPALDARAHRLVASVNWREHASISLGAAGEPDNGGTGWRSVSGASLSLGRYTLGLVREGLAGGFGAAHTFRLSMHF